MSSITNTLFLPISKGVCEKPDSAHNVCFYGAREIVHIQSNWSLIQSFYPYAKELDKNNHKVIPHFQSDHKDFDYIFAIMPKGKDESIQAIHQFINRLSQDGILYICASNNAGGKSLKKLLQKYDFTILGEDSKHKARVVWAKLSQIKDKDSNFYQQDIGLRQIPSTNFYSMPGIFGWSKIDKGSEILASYLPEKSKGKAADFGCGYGYLSHHLLRKTKGIKSLDCIDAEYKALIACKENLKNNKIDIEFLWSDLTTANKSLNEKYNLIIMNPPFHEGKKTDNDIGRSFIKTAYQALRPRGEIYMVANAHLPYDILLKETFFKISKLYEGKGFKIYHACK